PTDLRSRVGSLAAAIGEHTDHAAFNDAGQSHKPGAFGVPQGAMASAPSQGFTAMVDVMSRFDAHGQSLMGKPQSAAPLALNTGLDKAKDWAGQGALGAFGKASQ
ncbi:MAG: hypothetical protein ACOVOG_19245, partial [Rubrivivax sp.]